MVWMLYSALGIALFGFFRRFFKFFNFLVNWVNLVFGSFESFERVCGWLGGGLGVFGRL